MDNGYVDGLRQHDSRPRSPVIIPHNLSELRKKILFENTLLEERALHEFSAGKGDGAGVDTGSAPLKPLTSPTPTRTPTPTPTPTPAPAGIVVATTNTINVVDVFGYNATVALTKINNTLYLASVVINGYSQIYCEAYSDNVPIDIVQIRLIKEGGYWIYRYDGLYNCEENYGQNYDISSVLEVTSGIIPTTGWTPSITITAA